MGRAVLWFLIHGFSKLGLFRFSYLKSLFSTKTFRSALFFDELWYRKLEVNSETGRKTLWNLKIELLTITLRKPFQFFGCNTSTISSLLLWFLELIRLVGQFLPKIGALKQLFDVNMQKTFSDGLVFSAI